MKKKFVVIGASDSRFGDFVAEHWLKSLKKCIDLKVTDIVILNYGLTASQKRKITLSGAKVVDCVRDGYIVNLRYRDILNFLRKSSYNQVLACDSGDIIFQKNIMNVFYENSTSFRAVTESIQPPTLEYSFAKGTFSDKTKKEILKTLAKKRMVNGGFIAAPSGKFIYLCKSMMSMIEKMDSFGPDQIVLNYVLYKQGFADLGENFNYIPATAKRGCQIKNGQFYNGEGDLMHVVHNAGNYDKFRIIKNFGYGRNRNIHFKFFTYFLLRYTYKVVGTYRRVKNLFY